MGHLAGGRALDRYCLGR